MRRRAPTRRASGFTLIETMIVGFLFLLLAIFGLPALDKAITRGKLQGSAREAAVLMQLARFEAIKRSQFAGVAFRFGTGEMIAFLDTDPNAKWTTEDTELGRYQLPNGVSFWGPTDSGPGQTHAISGFDNSTEVRVGCATPPCVGRAPAGDGGEAVFRPDGSSASIGAVRVRDQRDNYLETRVSPAATARVFVQKYAGGDPTVEDNWDEPGEAGTDGDEQWTWQ